MAYKAFRLSSLYVRERGRILIVAVCFLIQRTIHHYAWWIHFTRGWSCHQNTVLNKIQREFEGSSSGKMSEVGNFKGIQDDDISQGGSIHLSAVISFHLKQYSREIECTPSVKTFKKSEGSQTYIYKSRKNVLGRLCIFLAEDFFIPQYRGARGVFPLALR